MTRFKSSSWEEVATQQQRHTLRSKGLGQEILGERQQGYEALDLSYEGWWPTKGLSGVSVAYTEERKALARCQDFVPPGKICSGLSLSPHPEHMSSTRDGCASLITVLLLEGQAEGGQACSTTKSCNT